MAEKALKFVWGDDDKITISDVSPVYEEWTPPPGVEPLEYVPGALDDEPVEESDAEEEAAKLEGFFDETLDVIEKNDWFTYVPRDKNGNWVSMNGAKSASTEETHADAARLHEAKAKFLRDKHPEKVAAAEAHERAAEYHRDAAEALKAGDPNAAVLSAAARVASEDADKASKGAGKGKYGKKPPKEKDKDKEPDKEPEPEPLKPGAIRPIKAREDFHANNVQAAPLLYGATCKGWIDPNDQRAHGAYASCGWDDKVRISKAMEDQLNVIVARAKVEGGVATITSQAEAFAVLAYAHENIHATGVKSESPYGGTYGSSAAEYQTDIGKVFEEGTTEGLSQLRWREQLETMNVRVDDAAGTHALAALKDNAYSNREVAAVHIISEYVAHGTMDNAAFEPGRERGALTFKAGDHLMSQHPDTLLSHEAQQALEDMAVRWAPRERTLRAAYATSLKADEINGAGGKATSVKPEESLTRLRATAIKAVMIEHASNLRIASISSKKYREDFSNAIGALCKCKSVAELEEQVSLGGKKNKWTMLVAETRTHANTPWLNGMDEYHAGMAQRMQSRPQQVKSVMSTKA